MAAGYYIEVVITNAEAHDLYGRAIIWVLLGCLLSR